MKFTDQLRLFDDEKKKRAPPKKLMHVIDAGPNDTLEGGPHMVRMSCKHCGFESEWFTVQTITEGKRGKPCPTCNKT